MEFLAPPLCFMEHDIDVLEVVEDVIKEELKNAGKNDNRMFIGSRYMRR